MSDQQSENERLSAAPCVPPCDHPPTEIAHCAGRDAVAHDRTPTVDGVCPVCGEGLASPNHERSFP